MRRFLPFAIAFALAIAATVVGWSQSLIYKVWPLVPLATWFPLVPISSAAGIELPIASLFQFPLFAVAFAIGIRRWSVARVIVVLTLIYGLMVAAALSIVGSR